MHWTHVVVERDQNPLLEVRGLTVSFKGPNGSTKEVVTDLDLTVGQGQRVALVGGVRLWQDPHGPEHPEPGARRPPQWPGALAGRVASRRT